MKQTTEQLDFSKSVKSILDGFWPLTRVEAYAKNGAEGLEGQVWAYMIEHGLANLTVAEQLGGSAGKLMDALPVLIEGGAHLMPASWVYKGLLPSLVLAGDNPAEKALVAAILRGDRAWLFIDPNCGVSAWGEMGGDVSAAPIHPVSNNLDVGVLGNEQVRVYRAEQLEPSVTRYRTADGSRTFTGIPQVRMELEPDWVLDCSPAAVNGYRSRWLALQLLAVAADSVGGAQRCLDISLNHAKSRRQFGVAIGTFQAVKHRMVDVHGAVRLAESALLHSAWLFDSEGASTRTLFTALVAKRLASRAYGQASETSVQVLGGMGFTWEAEPHWHVKRALMNSVLAVEDARAEERLFASLVATSEPTIMEDVFK